MGDSFDNWLADRVPDEAKRADELLPGTVLGSCTVRALLGRGGFADVYRADEADGTSVAVKILHRLDEKSRFRFEREARILAQVRHPNFPRLLGFGSCGNRPYMVTELLHACELPHGDHKSAAFLATLISAVGELHRRGYVHRDIKPSNVLVRRDGEPVLIDFGLAAPVSAVQRERDAVSTDGGKRLGVGTVGYSAPEQFSGLAAGPEADVHALGALIGDCFPEKMPRCWRRIYLTATNSNPKVRYPTVQALGRAIAWRHSLTVVLAFLGLSVLVLVGWFGFELMRNRAVQEPDRSEGPVPPIRFRDPTP